MRLWIYKEPGSGTEDGPRQLQMPCTDVRFAVLLCYFPPLFYILLWQPFLLISPIHRMETAGAVGQRFSLLTRYHF